MGINTQEIKYPKYQKELFFMREYSSKSLRSVIIGLWQLDFFDGITNTANIKTPGGSVREVNATWK